ncbi:hypothetical protein H072_469 [Dactylellina haptotyla CBS 200.50]|uniref:C2H2-type domain-containing protein n=1 Tax=Dactylellina haptotyla (strain CBS 200.50) TaxID=1284197 RepID=S8AX03_DACHA|nr:hypothetical protein H072_469 [Dactylellina haptotyla CBS 200.50]
MVSSTMGYYCFRCELVFVHKVSYDGHLDGNARHNICSICSEDFEDPGKLKEHENKAHNAAKNLDTVSTVIGLYLLLIVENGKHKKKAPDSEVQHLQSAAHTGKQQICPCGYKAKRPFSMLTHIEISNCPKKYTGHRLMHLISISVQRTSKGSFEPGANIILHRESKFMNNPIAAMDQESKDHTLIAYDEKRNRYVCQYCLGRFGTAAGLEKHVVEAKPDDGGVFYICGTCNKEFKYPSDLYQHHGSGSCRH